METNNIFNNTYEYTNHGKTTKVKLELRRYANNSRIAIRLLSQQAYGKRKPKKDTPFNEPFLTATVNLPESILLAYNQQFVDINNNPGIEKWLVSNKIATPTGMSMPSGFCTYPVYSFNLPE